MKRIEEGRGKSDICTQLKDQVSYIYSLREHGMYSNRNSLILWNKVKDGFVREVRLVGK
jgi:hypothetical protein